MKREMIFPIEDTEDDTRGSSQLADHNGSDQELVSDYRCVAPIAFLIPISRVRLRNRTSMMFIRPDCGSHQGNQADNGCSHG